MLIHCHGSHTPDWTHNHRIIHWLFHVPECKVWPGLIPEATGHCRRLFCWHWWDSVPNPTNWHGVGLQSGLQVGKWPVASGLNRAPWAGFVSWKPRRESADPSAAVSWDFGPIVSWALSDLPDLIRCSIHMSNGALSRVEFEHSCCPQDLAFVSVWNLAQSTRRFALRLCPHHHFCFF